MNRYNPLKDLIWKTKEITWQDAFNDLVEIHNEILDDQKELQKKLRRTDLEDEDRKETFDEWLDSVDDLWNLSNNIIKMSLNSQECLKYCEQAKAEIIKAKGEILK